MYAIDVGATTTQLYTINIANALATPVGAGFATTGVDYGKGIVANFWLHLAGGATARG